MQWRIQGGGLERPPSPSYWSQNMFSMSRLFPFKTLIDHYALMHCLPLPQVLVHTGSTLKQAASDEERVWTGLAYLGPKG